MTKEILLIARWHGRVIEAGTRLLSTATFDNSRFATGRNALEDDIFSFADLEGEALVQVIDVLHDFCFFLRKVIERAGVVDLAKSLVPHLETRATLVHDGRTTERAIELNDKSLWWWLGRVIHSESVYLLDGGQTSTLSYADGKTRDFTVSREYVLVASDFDREHGAEHVLHIPSLVRCFVSSGLRSRIDRIIAG